MFELSSTAMRKRFVREVESAGICREAAQPGPVVSAADVAALPDPVPRYLRFMGVLGRPRDVSMRLHLTGRFRLKPGPFMRCEAWQYNTRGDVARFFHLRMRYAGIMPLFARDTYRQGHGRMLGKLGGFFTIVDGTGNELDVGELVTYLNDAILMAPSLILGPETAWSEVDHDHFDVAFSDCGRTVRARVTIDERGAPTDFSTTDRFYQPDFKSPMQRTRWSTPVESMQAIDGRQLLRRARAVWHLASGAFTYAELELDPAGVAFNSQPNA